MDEQQIRDIIRDELTNLVGIDRYTFQKNLQIFNGRNIQVGKGTGTKIGTETTQKIGLYGKTPVVQGGAIADPAGGSTIDAQARTAISSILTVLRNIGIIST